MQGVPAEVRTASGPRMTRRQRGLAVTRRAALVSSRGAILTAAIGLGLLLATPARAADAADPIIDFTVARQDTLIVLSSQVLVSPDAWREVAQLNRLRATASRRARC